MCQNSSLFHKTGNVLSIKREVFFDFFPAKVFPEEKSLFQMTHNFLNAEVFLCKLKFVSNEVLKFFFEWERFLPECVAKGSRLTGESEGRAVFARRCFRIRNRSRLFMDMSRYYSVICIKMVCHARKMMHFAAQAQGFVKVKVMRLRRSYIGICSSRVVF